MGKFIDLKNEKFNKLTVVSYSHSKGGCFWFCKCECGKEVVVSTSVLKKGKVKSCGCYRSEMMAKKQEKHGMYGTSTYKSWARMIQRCNDVNYPRYFDYGGRGIKVCDEWLTFEGFYKDMGDRPKEMTLDRIDNNKGYCKENCKWADGIEQANNKRNNNLIEFNGKKQSLYQWSRELGLNRNTLNSRINQAKWSIERALTTPMINKKILPGGKV